MTLHLHSEYIEGCYRCDLSRSEALALHDLDDVIAELGIDEEEDVD